MPYKTFYSDLKKINTLEEEYLKYQRLLDDGKSNEQALKVLKLKAPPPTGRDNYEFLQAKFKELKMRNMRDFLLYYLNHGRLE